MPCLDLPAARYHYITQGDGPALLLLHGFTGACDNWLPHMNPLATRHRVIAPDLPGHGQTASGRYTMAQAADDLAALLYELAPAPAHILGYSMGGRLALYLALAHPERVASLVLESASPGLKTEAERRERRERDDALADRIEREGIAAFVDYWESLPLWHSQQQLPGDVRQTLRQQRLRNDPRGLAASLRHMGTGVQPSLWPRLHDIDCPTLLLAGALDAKFVAIAGDMHRTLPRSTFRIIPDAGHTIHLERPRAFDRSVLAFLRDCREA